MRFISKNAVFASVLFLCLLVTSTGMAVDIPDKPSNYVVDLAGLVDGATENKLNQYLQELEQKTTAQLVVLTITSLDGESIEDFSLKIAHDKWRLGQRGKDNGILFLISAKDRKYRIEVGYGLEGVLPDSLAGSLGRQVLVPYFKKGAYSEGIFATALVMANKIAEDAEVTITGMPTVNYDAGQAPRGKSGGPFSSVFGIIILILLVFLFIKNPRLFMMFFLASMLGGRRGSWGGGGGFGGGGGGFGGGGGGGFGGGGASGGW